MPSSGFSATVKSSLFADDTAVYSSELNPEVIANNLQHSADALGAWFRKWRIEVNPDKSQAVLFPRSRRKPLVSPSPISMLGAQVPWASHAKYLGAILDSTLSFQETLISRSPQNHPVE